MAPVPEHITRAGLSRIDLVRPPRELRELDGVASAQSKSRTAIAEEAALIEMWRGGEDIRLHEDLRFVPTPWGRWRLGSQPLANDRLERRLLRGDWNGRGLETELARLDREHGGRHVFDPDDPRFHQTVSGQWVLTELRLRPTDTPGEPHAGAQWVELLSLEAAAGRLGGSTQVVESSGWLLVRGDAPKGCFVAHIAGRSMEPRIPHGAYVLLKPGEFDRGDVLAVHPELADDNLVTCTIKRAVRDARGQLTLVAEHPDYRGRPILPKGASWEDVRIVAAVERVLAPTDFVGLLPEPRPCPPRGPLTAEELDLRLLRLQARRERLAAGTGPVHPRWRITPGRDLVPGELSLSAGAKELRLELPGWELPADLRQVTVAGKRTPASNLRRKAGFVVQPQTVPYKIEAPGAPTSLQGQLMALEVQGLASDRATVFRAPAGAGARLETGPLRSGSTFRLLVPPALAGPSEELLKHLGTTRLNVLDGWLALEIQVAEEPNPELDEALRSLGLERTMPGVVVTLVGVLPVRIDTLPSGAEVPVFDVGCPPIVQVSGAELGSSEVHVLVAAQGAEMRETLKPGSDGLIRLDAVPPGVVVVEARSSGGELEHDQETFLLEHNATTVSPVAQVMTFRCGSAAWPLDRPAPSPQDHRATLGPTGAWCVEGPPLWPLRLEWGVEQVSTGMDLRLDEQGLCAGPIAELAAFVESHDHASIRIDARELGSLRLVHSAQRDTANVARRLKGIDETRGVAVAAMLGAPERFDLWVRPVVQALGFVLGDHPRLEGGTVVVPLSRTEVVVDQVQCEPIAHLWVVGREASLSTTAEEHAGWLAAAVRAAGLGVGLVTDGVHWVRVQAQEPSTRTTTVDLVRALAAGDEAAITLFVDGFGVQRCG